MDDRGRHSLPPRAALWLVATPFTIAMILVSLTLAGCDAEPGSGRLGGVAVGASSGGAVGAVGTASGITLGGGSRGAFLGLGLGSYGSSRFLDDILAEDAARRALEFQPSGTVTTWHNPDNGHSGAFTPLNSFRSGDGRDCRDFRHVVTIGGQTVTKNGTACRQPDGTWRDVAG